MSSNKNEGKYGFGYVNGDQNVRLQASREDSANAGVILNAVEYGFRITRQVTEGAGIPDYDMAKDSITNNIETIAGLRASFLNSFSVTLGPATFGNAGGIIDANNSAVKGAMIHNAQVGRMIYAYVETNFKGNSPQTKADLREALTALAYNRGDFLQTVNGINQQSGTVAMSHPSNKGNQNRIYPTSAGAQRIYNKIQAGKMKAPSFEVSSSLSNDNGNVASTNTQRPTSASTNSQLTAATTEVMTVQQRAASIESQLKAKTAQNRQQNSNKQGIRV
jgi:hypothetical protein